MSLWDASLAGQGFPDPEKLRELIFSTRNCPLLFSNFIKEWPASEWTIPYLASVLQNEKILCRIGLRDLKDVQWETDCIYEEIRLGDFSEWIHNAPGPENPLTKYEREKYWAYVDYKYMKDVFSQVPGRLKDISWDSFGFPERDGRDSTMWLGSEGAYTVGHYDTYGCNLVAQITGKKRWILFPPEQTDNLYPTRVPFEESSVYSYIHINNPDLERFPKLKSTSPYIVELEPGQVLFVPRHWWHFVECLEPSVSVNTWIEMEEDAEERLKEAVSKMLVCSLMSCDTDFPSEEWLNPNEESLNFEENKMIIENALSALNQQCVRKSSVSCDKTTADLTGTKRKKPELECQVSGKYVKCVMKSPGNQCTAAVSTTDTGTEDGTVTAEIGDVMVTRGIHTQPSVKAVEPSSFEEYLGSIHFSKSPGQKVNVNFDQAECKLEDSEAIKILTASPEESMPYVRMKGQCPVLTTRNLVNCVSHPKVITLIANLIKENHLTG